MNNHLDLFRVSTELTPINVQPDYLLYRVNPSYIDNALKHHQRKIQDNSWNLVAEKQSCVQNLFIVKLAS